MGTGASTRVRAGNVCCADSELSSQDSNNSQQKITAPTEQTAENPVTLTKVSKISQNQNLINSQDDLHKAEKKIVEYEEKIKSLEKQMGELECNNLDLQDQLQHLSSLQNSGPESVREEPVDEKESGSTDCLQTVQAKDHIITTLEGEISNCKKEMRKLFNDFFQRIKHKKKVLALTQRWSEEKQEYSLEIMELRRKITELSAKTTKTDDQNGFSVVADKSVAGDSRAKLILDLSTRISELEEELIRTQAELRLKDNTDNHTSPSSRRDSRTSQNIDSSSVGSKRLDPRLDHDHTKIPTNSQTVDGGKNKTRYSPWSELDLSDTETQLDLLGSNSTSDHNHRSHDQDKDSTNFGLDPASLRKISAPKDRRRHKADSTILVSNRTGDKPTRHAFAENDAFTDTLESLNITHDAPVKNGVMALISS